MRFAATILTAIALISACARQTPVAQAPPATGFGPEVERGLALVRAVTARFQDLDSAVAAGYPREVSQCLSHADHGAMGYHHMNRALLDARVEVERPEILLYERRGSRYVLNGVEYIVPYTRWARDSVPPTVMGLPLKREDSLKLWYLHLWAWTENPEGLFNDWNPKVRCPAT